LSSEYNVLLVDADLAFMRDNRETRQLNLHCPYLQAPALAWGTDTPTALLFIPIFDSAS
jgi:hypothetical protein